MKLNTNADPRTNCNVLRKGGTIPDPWRTILNRLYTGLGGRGYVYLVVRFGKTDIYCLHLTSIVKLSDFECRFFNIKLK